MSFYRDNGHTPQPCWTCAHAVRRLADGFRCPWAWTLQPFDGMEYTPVPGRDGAADTCHIHACARYEWDGSVDDTQKYVPDYIDTEEKRAIWQERQRQAALRNWSARRRKVRAAAEEQLKNGIHPTIKIGKSHDGHCRDCAFAVIRRAENGGIKGDCLLLLSDPVPINGSNYCALHEYVNEPEIPAE